MRPDRTSLSFLRPDGLVQLRKLLGRPSQAEDTGSNPVSPTEAFLRRDSRLRALVIGLTGLVTLRLEGAKEQEWHCCLPRSLYRASIAREGAMGAEATRNLEHQKRALTRRFARWPRSTQHPDSGS